MPIPRADPQRAGSAEGYIEIPQERAFTGYLNMLFSWNIVGVSY